MTVPSLLMVYLSQVSVRYFSDGEVSCWMCAASACRIFVPTFYPWPTKHSLTFARLYLIYLQQHTLPPLPIPTCSELTPSNSVFRTVNVFYCEFSHAHPSPHWKLYMCLCFFMSCFHIGYRVCFVFPAYYWFFCILCGVSNHLHFIKRFSPQFV